ncbi:MAG: 4-hydroxy-tetrahydrodipicolinate reductase [Terriglobales bacterium]
MNIIILGGLGKVGSLVAEVARERGHNVTILEEPENAGARALTRDALRGIDVVVDFTTPRAVLENIAACVEARANMVVGTTGWYGEIPRIKKMVEQSGIGFLFAPNFSIGVNLFFNIVRAAAPAIRYGYQGRILEKHHVHKKDAPSGTAATIRDVIRDVAQSELPIESVREGEIVGLHQVTFESAGDTITLVHDAKSRRGFAEGAVRAAEWLRGKRGFYDFKDIFRDLR